eukprot:g1444.t1
MSLQPWGGHGDLEPITLGTPGESSRGLKTPSTGRSRPPVKFQDDRRSLWQWQCQAEQRLNELLQLEKDRGAAVRELRQDVRAMSRAVAILQEQRSFDRVASMLSVAMTAALARSKSRRKVMLFSSDRDADEAGGPVALVLRSKLQELAKTTSAQRAAKRWQDPKLGRNRSKQKRSK